MKILIEAESVHHEDEIGPLIVAATIGDNIERALRDQTSPFAAMMFKARKEFLAAQLSLLEADLHTTAGIEQARSLQAQAKRYADLCRWITDAWDDRERALDDIDGAEEEPAVEELKDMHDASRAKPAPDA
jgi:hypothetical protein